MIILKKNNHNKQKINKNKTALMLIYQILFVINIMNNKSTIQRIKNIMNFNNLQILIKFIMKKQKEKYKIHNLIQMKLIFWQMNFCNKIIKINLKIIEFF